MTFTPNPTPIEWAALVAFFTASSLCSISFVIFAQAFHWKQWYKRVEAKHPAWLIPEIYGLLRTLSVLFIGLAAWYAWRAAYVADPLTTTITNATFMAAMVLLFILLAFTAGFGYVFFYIGLQLSWMIVGMVCEIITLGVSIALTYYFWLLSTAAGVIQLIISVFFLGSVICVCLYWHYLRPINTTWDPIDFIFNTYEGVQSKQKMQIKQQMGNVGSSTVPLYNTQVQPDFVNINFSTGYGSARLRTTNTDDFTPVFQNFD